MNHTDCIGQIVEYISGLNQISRCVRDSLKSCDFESAFDCTYKFYTARETISASIILYRGVLTDEEIVKYHSTLNNIMKDMQKESLELAKRCNEDRK